jgi:hypothetical protein
MVRLHAVSRQKEPSVVQEALNAGLSWLEGNRDMSRVKSCSQRWQSLRPHEGNATPFESRLGVPSQWHRDCGSPYEDH